MVGCIIQASRYAWDGSDDYCINKVNEKYLVEYVIETMKQIPIIKKIVLAVPKLKENSIFVEVAKKHGIDCYLGSADNVLERFINAAEITGADIIVKTLGQNFFLDGSLIERMIDRINSDESIEFLQLPDDYESKFLAEVFKKDVLYKVSKEINKFDFQERKKFLARPISFIKISKEIFNIAIYTKVPTYTEEYLLRIRELSKDIYSEERVALNPNTEVEAGNFYIERYKFASKFIDIGGVVLDIACGSGFGASYIYKNISKNIIGADINELTINENIKRYPEIKFSMEDATNTSFQNDYFDTVVSIETIEHIPLELVEGYLKEMKRILKSGGTFICSTPQNGNGLIPLNHWHVKEYSLQEFKELLSQYFYIEKVYGSKSGVYSEDEKGTGMMAICRKCER